jgi:hypothetical protein
MTERLLIPSSGVHREHAVRLLCVGSAIALLAACGGVDFATAGDGGVATDAPRNGGDAGRDSPAKDAHTTDGAPPIDTGTPGDTGAPDDTGTPHDTGAPTDTGGGHDGGEPVDGGAKCLMGTCTLVGDCNAVTPSSCKAPACTGDCCSYTNKGKGTPCSNGQNGTVCTADGVCVQCNGDADCAGGTHCSVEHTCVECLTAAQCPQSNETCEVVSCSVAGVCGTTAAPTGSPCTGEGPGVCSSSGTCVQCLTDADCTAPLCQSATCVNDACSYAVDPSEVGQSCGPTAGGYVCTAFGDCCVPPPGTTCVAGTGGAGGVGGMQ